MKNDRGIKLLMDDLGEDPVHPLDAADQDIENDEIDRLLRLVADESTAKIDFEAIKQRAVSSANASQRKKRGRLRKAASYALFACAALVLGFTLMTVLKNVNGPINGDISAFNTPSTPKNTPDSTGRKGASGDNTPLWRMEAGTVSNDTYKIITEKVSDFFPDSLPDNMIKLVEDSEAHISAIGTDRNGSEICYDFVMCTEAPIPLETGEACSVEDGEFIVYYWQVSDENCMSVRFAGFEQQQTDSMFNQLTKRIVQIVPNDGRR